ncbi:MAG: hypothetical protein P8181_08945, partial [bacterium]
PRAARHNGREWPESIISHPRGSDKTPHDWVSDPGVTGARRWGGLNLDSDMVFAYPKTESHGWTFTNSSTSTLLGPVNDPGG